MKKYSILFVTLLLLATSCSDSFFDLTPSNSIVKKEFYITASDFNLATVACYSKLQSQVHFYTECSEYRSDNLALSAPTTGTQDRYDIDQFLVTASNGILLDYWANFNNGVFRCNSVLDQIDGADFDEKLKKQYKGEALFIRALTYFNMYRTWGGVPTTTKVVSVSESLQIGRSSDQQMYELIAGDLKNIIDGQLLPDSYTGNDIGRATSGAVLALLGKVHLTFHKWSEASNTLSQVIGKYELLSDPAKVFDVNNKMNREIIFAVRFNKDIVGEGHSMWHTTNNPLEAENPSPVLIKAYADNDLRKPLISYVKSGNQYVIKKFFDEINPSTNTVGNDQILLRYADVLLMYAEALNEIAYNPSVTSPAFESLNLVRKRAGLSPVDNTVLNDMSSFRKAVMVERQLEFPYEGHRWFDIVRMGFAKEVMLKAGHTVQDYQYLYPIPKTALERINNTSLLWQNTGYK